MFAFTEESMNIEGCYAVLVDLVGSKSSDLLQRASAHVVYNAYL